MKKNVLILTLLMSVIMKAQTPSLNQQKYWDYRDRLKKWYVKIGDKTGESQLMTCRATNMVATGRDTTKHGLRFPKGSSWMQWGDNTTIHLGYYIATLSMEYKLLKKNGQNTTATINEIYYALCALNRLDSASDPYLVNPFAQTNRDGILLRTDVRPSTVKDWVDEDSSFIIDSKSYRTYNEQWKYWDDRFDGTKGYGDSIPYNPVNIMSVDEVMGVALGVVSIIKFVDNVYVKPDAALPGYYIVDEGKAILKRIINEIYRTKYKDTCIAIAIPPIQYTQFNWAFENPSPDAPKGPDALMNIYSDKVPIGGMCWWGPAVTLGKIGNIFLNGNYGDTIVARNCKNANQSNLSQVLITGIFPVAGAVKALVEAGYNTFKTNAPSICWNWLKVRPYQNDWAHPNVEDQWKSIDSVYNSFTNTGVITNTTLIDSRANDFFVYDIMLGILSHELDPTQILFYSETLGGRELLLFNALFNNAPIGKWPKSFYDTLLNDAPLMENPGINSSEHYNCNYFGSDNTWHVAPRERGSGGGNVTGQKNGLDYMFLYNLYHLYFDSNTSYKESPCDCYKYQFDTVSNLINTAKVLKRVHPDYKYKNIPDPRYINRNTTITDFGSLTTYSDLYICHRPDSSPTWLTSTHDINVGHPSDTQKIADMVIRGGNGVHLDVNDNEGKLTVNNRSRLLMEDESQIIVEPACSLYLANGSTLINKGGKIRIKAGGYFVIDSGAVANIYNNGSLIIDSGATLVVNNTGLLNIDSNASLITVKKPYIYLNGPNSQLAINANLILKGDTASFHYYRDTFHRYYYAGFCNFGPNLNVTVENATRANMYFVGDSNIDIVLKIRGNVSITDSVSSPTHYIDSIVFLNGQIEGINNSSPKLTIGSKLFARYCNMEAVTIKSLGQYAEIYHNKFESAGYMNYEVAGYYVKEQSITNCHFINSGIVISGGKSKFSGCDFYNESGMNCTKVKKLTLYNNAFYNNVNTVALTIIDATRNLMATKHANYFLEANNFINNNIGIKLYNSNLANDGASINLKCCLFKDNYIAIDAYDLGNFNMSRTWLCDSVSGGDNSFSNNQGDSDILQGFRVPIKLSDAYIRNGHNSFVYDTSYFGIYRFISSKITIEYRLNTIFCDNNLGKIRIDSNFWYPQTIFNGTPNTNIQYLAADWQPGGNGPHAPPALSFTLQQNTILDTIDITCLKSIVEQPFKIKTDGKLKKYWGNVDIASFYPNPNLGIFQVDLNLQQSASLQGYYIIYDVNGSPIYTSSTFGLSEGHNWIDISQGWLPAGMYVIKFFFVDGTYVYQFFIVI